MKIVIRLEKPLGRYRKGTELEIECDETGKPIEFFWQKRFQSAFYDKSLVIIAENKKFKHNIYKVQVLNKTVNKNKREGVNDNHTKTQSNA